MNGKDKCKILKNIRKEIADKNNIIFTPRDCHFDGECKGTCPLCEQEADYILEQLKEKVSKGEDINTDISLLGELNSFYSRIIDISYPHSVYNGNGDSDWGYRKLPVYILLDNSSGVKGEMVNKRNSVLYEIINQIKSDPYALETVQVSIVSYDSECNLVLGMTEVCNINMDSIIIPTVDETGNLDSCLAFVHQRMETDILRQSLQRKGDWKAIVIIITAGNVLNNLGEGLELIKSSYLGTTVVYNLSDHPLPKHLVSMSDLVINNINEIRCAFRWVSNTVVTGSVSLEKSEELPPPLPREISIIL